MSSHNAVPFGLTGTITGILGGGCGLLSVKEGEESEGLCCWFFLVSIVKHIIAV